MLTVEELAGMQTTRESNLPDVCNVVEIEYVKDTHGNATEAAVTGPDFACRIATLGQGSGGSSNREAVILDRLGVVEAWKIVAPRDEEIRLQDRILVDVDGHTRLLEVVAAPGPRSYELAHAWIGVEVK